MGKIYKYANLVLEKIQKNNRKINAIIRKNQIHRIKIYIMLIYVAIILIRPIYAIENEEFRVLCKIDPNMYVKYTGNPQPNYEYYCLKNNEEYPVYCVNLGMKGAEEEKDGYLVKNSGNLSDRTLKSIALNCYPYKTIEELGVYTKEQAKFASQYAIWIYTANLNIELIEPITHEYQNVVDAIKKIYYAGVNEAKSIELFEFKKSSQKIEKVNNELYYTRAVLLINSESLENIEITTEQKNIIIEKNHMEYKIYVPIGIVDEKYNLKLNVKFLEKNALYGVSTKEGYQDVIITTLEDFEEDQALNLDFVNMKNKVTILKKDKDTNLPISGVVYEIRNENDEFLGQYETDINGKIELEVLEEKSLYVTEIKTLDEYVLDSTKYSLQIDEKKDNIFELYNTKKKGNIKIIKKSKEYNELTALKENTPLENVSFYIYDENMNLVDDITTDEYGIAITKKLSFGKYYIKEYKTQEYYQILDQLIEVEITSQEATNVEILNNNVNIPKKLPTTGR